MEAEPIPDTDAIHRLIEFPRMYTEVREFVWPEIFTFPDNEGVSVVWSKYAPTPADINQIGCDREAHVRARKPQFRYEGHITTAADAVRTILSSRGHRFVVLHVPKEGQAHAEIRYAPLDGVQFSRTDRTELKVRLAEQWSALQSHSCLQAA